MTILTQTELEKVQTGEDSPYWEALHQDPTTIQSWMELALAPTAWSWMDKEINQKDIIWKKLWQTAVTWPMADSDLVYVEQALRAWSDVPIWTPTVSLGLIQQMEKKQERNWLPLLTTQNLAPNKFGYHLLHALALHTNSFPLCPPRQLWDLIVGSAELRPVQKELLYQSLLSVTQEKWEEMGFANPIPSNWEPGMAPSSIWKWWDDIQKTLPHQETWFKNWFLLQSQMDMEPNRINLVEQWKAVQRRHEWALQTKEYENFDFNADPF